MSQNVKQREHVLVMARLAEQSERFDDMIEFMVTLIKMGTELNIDEQNMLSIAFKNVVGARRSAWRVISSYAHRGDPDDITTPIAHEYVQKVENELKEVCQRVLDLLDKYLIPMALTEDKNIFYYKMKGDYYRYLAEIKMDLQDPARIEIVQKADDAYQQALNLSIAHLEPTDPIRLGIALNYSVFFYEIENSTIKACKLARTAFESAIAKLDKLSGDSYKDSTLIMQLLRDNLTLWASDVQEDGDPLNGEDADPQESPNTKLRDDHVVMSNGNGEKNGSMTEANNHVQCE